MAVAASSANAAMAGHPSEVGAAAAAARRTGGMSQWVWPEACPCSRRKLLPLSKEYLQKRLGSA